MLRHYQFFYKKQLQILLSSRDKHCYCVSDSFSLMRVVARRRCLCLADRGIFCYKKRAKVKCSLLLCLVDIQFYLSLSCCGSTAILQAFFAFISRTICGKDTQRQRNCVKNQPRIPYFLMGTSFSKPPMYLRSTSGMVTEPSAFWFCSSSAGNTRLVARPLAFNVCM